MKCSTIAVISCLVLAACGAAPEDGTPTGTEQVGEISQASIVVILQPQDPRFSFQGQFQLDDCGIDNIPNDAWPSGFNCPFSPPIRGGRALMPESGCGGNQFQCEQVAFSFSNSLKFGGIFQVDDCGVNNIGNAYNNGNLSCPRGFFQDDIGRVKAPESNCGATQYLCDARPNEAGGETFSDNISLGVNTLRWGGQYQQDDCGTNTRVNPLTGGLSCPSVRYAPIRYGRVKGPEGGQCGVNQFVCIGVEPH
jgi:hypothetical protein